MNTSWIVITKNHGQWTIECESYIDDLGKITLLDSGGNPAGIFDRSEVVGIVPKIEGDSQDEVDGPGPVRADEVYPLPAFQQRFGLSGAAWRELERKGLKAVKVGKRKFIKGSDAIAFFGEMT